MKLSTIPTLLCSILLISVPVKAEDFSAKHPNSSAALFSSAVISGVILLPLLIPAQIVVESVQFSEKDKTTTITGTTKNNEKAALVVATEKLEKKPVKPRDILTLEPAEEGAGNYLKKDGAVISHMISQDEQNLSYQGRMSQ
ncbi:STM0539 family protein [Morganella morganii]|uniref:STM0539 family protein n=1 Tax=Morganella morganii TaxID=582 RepID=UPI001C48BE1E|nr:STM0539 family protein [Morganella morganii]QXO71139.1 STM0539 family protein [Morganella morganii]